MKNLLTQIRNKREKLKDSEGKFAWFKETQSFIFCYRKDTSNVWKKIPFHFIEEMKTMHKDENNTWMQIPQLYIVEKVRAVRNSIALLYVVEEVKAMCNGKKLHLIGCNWYNYKSSLFLYSVMLSYQEELQLFCSCAIAIFIYFKTT